ncbi:unnamed protein product, partial [Amoebophrya sp. A25]
SELFVTYLRQQLLLHQDENHDDQVTVNIDGILRERDVIEGFENEHVLLHEKVPSAGGDVEHKAKNDRLLYDSDFCRKLRARA